MISVERLGRTAETCRVVSPRHVLRLASQARFRRCYFFFLTAGFFFADFFFVGLLFVAFFLPGFFAAVFFLAGFFFAGFFLAAFFFTGFFLAVFFFAAFWEVFFVAFFLVGLPPPNAAAQPSEYFPVAPILKIVIGIPSSFDVVSK